MERILISACLVGEKVRYDGKSVEIFSTMLERWKQEGRLIPFCPEVAGGLPVPRPPAEIIAGTGQDVLNGSARIINIEGKDVTNHFLSGARQALQIAQQEGIRIAILKSHSPSCGLGGIYDGTFSGKLRRGHGVTAALLKQAGLFVFTEEEIEEAGKALSSQEVSK